MEPTGLVDATAWCLPFNDQVVFWNSGEYYTSTESSTEFNSPDEERVEYFTQQYFNNHGPQIGLYQQLYDQHPINVPLPHQGHVEVPQFNTPTQQQLDINPQAVEEDPQENEEEEDDDDVVTARRATLQRQRKKSRTESNASSLVSQLSSTAAPGEGGRKHTRNREKNRLAASKCREKAKKHVDELREREKQLAAVRAQLTAHKTKLKEEMLALKNEILRHSDCNCDFIQQYLNTAARQVV
jgi:hypothetical protein